MILAPYKYEITVNVIWNF